MRAHLEKIGKEAADRAGADPWWFCDAGHDWQGTPRDVQDRGCPRCGRIGKRHGASDEGFPVQAPLIGCPPRFAWPKLADAEIVGSSLRSRVQRFAAIREAIEAMARRHLVFSGPSASGKTSLAVACLVARGQAAIKFSHPRPLFVSSWRLAVARANHQLGAGEAFEVDRAMNWPGVVLLDDLGSERPAPSSPITDVIFERHDQDRPTWFTTWATPDETEKRYGAGIARRVFEDATIIDCGGKLL
jgi:hypothetical protein